MKTSLFLAAAGAGVAMAGPFWQRAITTEVIVEYKTVTVTADAPEETTSVQRTLFANGGHGHKPTTTVLVKAQPTTVKTTSTTAKTSSTAHVVVVTVTAGKTAATTAKTTTSVATTAKPTNVAKPATTVEATSTALAVTAPSDMASTALYAHNLHRANHSAPEMSWLNEIASYAQNTANTCTFAHDMTQGSGNYGQNIAMWATSSGAADLGAAGAIGMASHDMWYNNEVTKFLPSYYGEATPDMGNFEAWGHFSQLVWKDSTSLGCYAKLCAKGTMFDDMDAWYMVCNYRPAGNMGGSYGKNVLASLEEPTVTN